MLDPTDLAAVERLLAADDATAASALSGFVAITDGTVETAKATTLALGARSLESILALVGVGPEWNLDAYSRVVEFQRAVGTYPDGVWGRGTENAVVRRRARQEALLRGARTEPLTVSEVVSVARAAGFSGEGLVNAVSVAIAESGAYRDGVWTCDPIARLVNIGPPRSIDRGLWQINDYWHAEVIDWKADDPTLAAREAFRISRSGSSWTAWSTWNNGTAAKRRPIALAAIG